MKESAIPSSSSEGGITREGLVEIYGSVKKLYRWRFHYWKDVKTRLFPPIEDSRHYVKDDAPMIVPRGRFERQALIELSATQKVVKNVTFLDDWINIINGDSSAIDPQNPTGVFTEILKHEIIHSQTTSRAITGVINPVLRPSDISYGGDIHYVTGFNVFSIDLKNKISRQVMRPFEEYTAQYLAMSLTDQFGNQDPILNRLKEYGQSIGPEFIEAAEELNKIFTIMGISAEKVEEFHRSSDLRGFLELLRSINPETARLILKAGMSKDFWTGVQRLKEVHSTLQ